jgi:hypothetical protein
MHSAFQHDYYLLKRQVLALTGKFRLYGPAGQLVLYCQQKMFRLKEDIRAYSDESMRQELLYIQARSILDFSAAYDVIDSQEGERVGILRRNGFRSLLRDEWEIFSESGEPPAVMTEDSIALAMLRRLALGSWLPQSYDILVEGLQVADLRQHINPFRYELDLDFHKNTAWRLDHRLGIAAAVLLGTIEGRQE